jgi:hypothetical protein
MSPRSKSQKSGSTVAAPARSSAPRVPGVTISFSGRELVVPPLRVGDIKDILPAIRRISAPLTGPPMERFEQLDDYVDVIHVALKRNYPELTRDELLEITDFPAFLAAFRAALAKYWTEPRSATSAGA